MVFPENIKLTTLDNGLRIVTEKVDYVKSVSLGIWVKAGSIYENKENNGISHLIEHLLFKGTKKRSSFQIAYDVESLGGTINAFTTKDITCYYVRTIDEHLSNIFDVITDLVRNYDLNDGKLNFEKKVVYEEIKESEDDPFEYLNDCFGLCLYPDHPYGFPIQGTIESVKRISLEDVQDFISRFYRPENIVVSAAGNLDHDEVLILSEKLIFTTKNIKDEFKIPSLTHPKEKTYIFNKDIKQAHVILGRRTFPIWDDRRYVLNLFNIMLSGGMSSRLFQNIREKYGYVYSINSFIDFFDNQGVFGLYAGVNSKKIERVIDLMYNEMEKFIKGDLKHDEIKKAKEQLKSSIIFSFESMSSRMNRLAKMLIYENKIYSIDDIISKVEIIDIDDIVELSRFLYNKNEMIEVILKR